MLFRRRRAQRVGSLSTCWAMMLRWILRGAARDRSREAADVAREPTSGELARAVGVVRGGHRRIDEPSAPWHLRRGVGVLLRLGAELLEHRQSGVSPSPRAAFARLPNREAAAPGSPRDAGVSISLHAVAGRKLSSVCPSRLANCSHIIVRSWPSEPLATFHPPCTARQFSAAPPRR